MRRPRRVFYAAAMLIASVGLSGCQKQPPVPRADRGALGPAAAVVDPRGWVFGPVTAVPADPHGAPGASPRPGLTPQPEEPVVALPTPPVESPIGTAPPAGPSRADAASPQPLPPAEPSVAGADETAPLKDVFFEFDDATIGEDQRPALHAAAAWLKANPTARLTVEGYADERGTSEYNMALGYRRALVAKDYLVALGVHDERIEVVSYGEERPFVLGHDETVWKWNRRAHLAVIQSG